MSNNRYVRLTKGVNDRGILVKPEEVLERIDSEKDYYVSTYYYNEEQYKQFQQTKTVKGIRDVTSDQVWFDFDSKDDLSLAQNDVKVLLERVKKYADPKSAEVYFSGNKGFTVILKLNKFLNPKQIEYLALEKFGKDLKTLDASLYDSAQILRVPGTKHQVSGLYKIPLTTKEIQSLTPDEIKKKASSLDQISDEFDWKPMDLSEELLDIPESKAEVPVQSEFSIENKPRYWKTTKWAIAQGYFEPGERHEAMMVLAATCRGMNYDKITTYYICKASLDKHMQRTGREDKFSKEELWENIIENSVFSDEWQGGQYGDEHPLIKKIAARLNISLAKDNSITKIDETFALFKDYANNIDKLTIRSGIPALDAKLRMTVGMSVGIVGAPSSGKTSLALQVLNNMSKRGEKCLFFSYDMYHALVYQKLVQKHLGISSDEIFRKFKEKDIAFERMVHERIQQEYKNVDFCFQSGQSIQDIIETIKESEQKSGQKVRLVVLDYNELIMTDYSDPTQSSSYIAQKLREIANIEQLCVVSLFQPSKISGSPSDDIKSYRSAKGSSAIEQSVSVMLGVSRPGFDPRAPDNDKFLTLNGLKNRMGPLFTLDLRWDGLRGTVRELTSEEKDHLRQIREAKETKSGDWE